MSRTAFAVTVVALCALCAISAAGPDERLVVDLAETPIEPGNLKTVLGLSLRADQSEAAPEGFEFVFRMPGREVSFLRKTAEDGSVEIYFSGGESLEKLPEWGGTVMGSTKAFGPVRIGKGLPLVTVHVPVQRAQNARPAAGYAYVMPASMLAGSVEINGRMVRIALIDANLDGDCSDPCVQHMRSGDWFAVDLNGDAKMLIDQSGNEGRPLTRLAEIGGKTWSWKIEGTTLKLMPSTAGIFQVRIDGLGQEAEVYGWSDLTGSFKLTTRDDGSFEIPVANALVYNYTLSNGDWKAVGSLATRGKIISPGSGGEVAIKAGPPVRAMLTAQPSAEGTYTFNAKLTGSAGESFTLSKGGRQAPPAVLVIIGPDGAQAHRATMTYG